MYSVGKESTCNAGDPSLIPGSGRSSEERIGYSLWYCWASLVAQLVKHLPTMWETWVRSLSWEDPLEKEKATHSSILAWVTKSWTQLSDFRFIYYIRKSGDKWFFKKYKSVVSPWTVIAGKAVARGWRKACIPQWRAWSPSWWQREPHVENFWVGEYYTSFIREN